MSKTKWIKKWLQLDDHLEHILEVVMKGDVGRKMKTMPTMGYNICKDMHGVKQPKGKGPKSIAN